ncbi:hypothetical protein DO70_420 [Burkholderia pseudomallei]|nr:hypothetical protein DO70_420 [Burkholderia pseudomallei]
MKVMQRGKAERTTAEETRICSIEGTLNITKDMPSIIGDGTASMGKYHLDLAELIVQSIREICLTVLQSIVEPIQLAMQQIDHTVAELGDIAKNGLAST